ncbi:MAG: glycosyltransferase family 39 protein [archaeon]
MAPRKPAGFWVFALVAASFLLSLLHSFREGYFTEIYYGLALSDNLFDGYLGMWKGNDPRIGPFWPIFLKVSRVLAGPASTVSAYFAFAVVSALVSFLIYLLLKDFLDRKRALLFGGFLLVSAFFPFADKNYNELGIQALLSLLFIFILFQAAKTGTVRLVSLLGLVAGIGIMNKIFFLAFLVAAGISCLLSGVVRFRALVSGRERLVVFLLSAIAGLFPFLVYNLTAGKFGTIGAVLKTFSGGGRISSVSSIPLALLERAGNLTELLRLSPEKACLLLAFFLLYIFSIARAPFKDLLIRRKFLFWLWLSLLVFFLSIFNYHQYLWKVHLSAISFSLTLFCGFPFLSLSEKRARLAMRCLALAVLVLLFSFESVPPLVAWASGGNVFIDRTLGIAGLQKEVGFSKAYVQEPYTMGLFSEIFGEGVELVLLGSAEDARSLVEAGDEQVFLLAQTGDGILPTDSVRRAVKEAADESGLEVEERVFPEPIFPVTYLRVFRPA